MSLNLTEIFQNAVLMGIIADKSDGKELGKVKNSLQTVLTATISHYIFYSTSNVMRNKIAMILQALATEKGL